jgi:hypothetical protein
MALTIHRELTYNGEVEEEINKSEIMNKKNGAT